MSTRNDGIQQLLQAEKRAADKVNEARKRKARRLKQAKQEAQIEIEIEKKNRENQYRAHEESILGTRSDSEQQVNVHTENKLRELSFCVERNKSVAIDRLLALVCEIEPKLHINYQI